MPSDLMISTSLLSIIKRSRSFVYSVLAYFALVILTHVRRMNLIASKKKAKAALLEMRSTMAKGVLVDLRSQLERLWNFLDLDADGRVTVAELKLFLARREKSQERAEINRLFRQLQDDRAGNKPQSHVQKHARLAQRTWNALNVLDIDKNGSVSKEEFFTQFAVEVPPCSARHAFFRVIRM